MSKRLEHWDRVYERTASEELGWHQPQIATLALVTAHSTPASSVVDVGGGDSRLVDGLLERSYEDVTVLDLSGVALSRAQARLGDRGDAVTWIEADLMDWNPGRQWDLWHDRAVFHFLTEPEDRQAYVGAACKALAADGLLIVAAFGTDGPDMCAGLPVCRYDADSLAEEFVAECEVVHAGPLPPATPTDGDQRPFVAVVLRCRDLSGS